MSDIDKWLSEGGAFPEPPAPAAPPSNGAPSPSKAPKSLSKLGVDVKGGVIRNPSTKIKTQGENPLTNPRPGRGQKPGSVAKTVPPADPIAELKAEHPALAVSSMFTGMDIDLKQNHVPTPAEVNDQAPPLPPVRPAAAPPMAPQEFKPTLETTIRQLLEQAYRQADKRYNVVSEGRFLVYAQILNPESGSPA